MKYFVHKCVVGFLSNLETEFQEWRLAEYAVQNTLYCSSSTVARHSLFGVYFSRVIGYTGRRFPDLKEISVFIQIFSSD